MTKAVIVDSNNAVVFGPAIWSGFSFGVAIGGLLDALPDRAIAGVPLGGHVTLTEALSWEGCPFRVLPCAVVGDAYDPDTQTLGDPVVTVAEDGQSALAVYSPADKPVDDVAGWAVERINREAGAQRGAHITVAVGQEATYLAKQAEAARFAAGGGGVFPYLDAEAEATGATRAEVAAVVLATAEAWTVLNARIEGRRRGLLVATEAARVAGDVAAIRALFPLTW
ncbi:hypothetical protein [Brevundimonas sp.]|uniref:hypothetical protein n=1 Tax=Brevundimonas sp. TaxID=1871086 RepID=UPI002D740783|nr:hypothetical protein [Brevundimonas sp.]HYD29185.1 hypothetical protein [Brevundimonas sp.]